MPKNPSQSLATLRNRLYKKHARKNWLTKLVQGEDVETLSRVIKTSLELLVSSKTETNKSRWKVAKFWELAKINGHDFSIAEADMTIAQTLEWLRVCIANARVYGKKSRKANGFDIYELLERKLTSQKSSRRNNSRMLDKVRL